MKFVIIWIFQKITYLQLFPYKVFKIKNFFEKDYYGHLNENFPNILSFSKEITKFIITNLDY